MNIQDLLGRVLMTAATVMGTVIPLFVDLSPSHVLNPAWPAHARLHEVWLLATASLVGLVALYYIWLAGGDRRRSLGLATVLTLAVFGGFFIAAATEHLYGGVLVDPLAAPAMPNQDMLLGLPANAAVFGLGIIIAIVGFLIARSASKSTRGDIRAGSWST